MKAKNITLILIYLATGTIYLTAGLSKFAPENIGNLIGPVDIHKIFDSTAFIIFMEFIAVLQVITGALLISLRYSVLGLIIAIPMALGILLFTVIAGFGLTPIINLVLLVSLIYAYLVEKDALKLLLKRKIIGLKESKTYQLYPKDKYAKIALALIALTVVFSFLHNIVLNIFASLAFFFYTANLFQRKDYLFLDKVLIGLFFIIGIITVNAMLLKAIHPKAPYVLFILIPLSISIYILRLVYWRFFTDCKEPS